MVAKITYMVYKTINKVKLSNSSKKVKKNFISNFLNFLNIPQVLENYDTQLLQTHTPLRV